MNGIQARFRLDWPGFTLDVDLDLPARGVTALFGHSGSGKTTLLRCMAGLERASQGRLTVNGEIWQDVGPNGGFWLPTHKRPVGYVFQEASLFPHLTVMGNLRYGLRRISGAQQESLDQAIELLGIGHLLERKPDRLSGGERSRIGIARALALRPRLLLMDEPLAALDLKRKQEILPYLERLHAELDIPVIYVSHAPDEVARLADHLVVMDTGRAIAAGPLTETLARLDLPIHLGEDAGVVLNASWRSGMPTGIWPASSFLEGVSGCAMVVTPSALRFVCAFWRGTSALPLKRLAAPAFSTVCPPRSINWLQVSTPHWPCFGSRWARLLCWHV